MATETIQRNETIYFAGGYYAEDAEGKNSCFQLVKPAGAGSLPYVSRERSGSLRMLTRHHANFYSWNRKDSAYLVWEGSEQIDPPKTQKLTFEQQTELKAAIDRGVWY
jgi:hypothetical protein